MLRITIIAAGCAACGSALRVGPLVGRPRVVGKPCSSFAPQFPAMAAVAPLAAACARSTTAPRMQATDFYDEYVETDPVTGEQKTLTLDEKEKLYLECVDAFYNEDGKQLLGNDEYEQLKLDLDFDGSKVATYSKDEIRFLLANKRFRMGKAVLTDSEYDSLRDKLTKAGSLVVLHEGASCNLDTGLCKTDLRVDEAKTRLLYLPGTAGGLLLVMEAIFWLYGLDPIFSVILGAVPAYFFGIYFTENIFAQRPLVVQASCPEPECESIFPVFFGDLFAVREDGIAGPPDPRGGLTKLVCKCPVCKIDLEADREKMILVTMESKKPA